MATIKPSRRDPVSPLLATVATFIVLAVSRPGHLARRAYGRPSPGLQNAGASVPANTPFQLTVYPLGELEHLDD